jgi:hypothetical protein
MKRIFWLSIAGVVVVLVCTIVWQHGRYADARRESVQDYQDLFHGDAFHVLTFFKVDEDTHLLSDLRTVKRVIEQQQNSQLVYAGKVIYMGLYSKPLNAALGEPVAWDAIFLQQFESRQAYDSYLKDPRVRTALDAFPIRFAHGFRRSASTNLMLPQILLAMKIQRLATLTPSPLPFEDADPSLGLEFPDIGPPLLAEADNLGKDAVLIVNLTRTGDAAQQAADASYSSNMLGLMADAAHGPLHIGAAEPIDHPIPFDTAALVYYPGSRYFRDLIMSAWYQEIYQDKQLADSLSCVTVPITDHL